MVAIHRDNQFEKCLEYLKRAGGIGALAAKRADALIEELARSRGNAAPETCRLTRNGEARIRYCRKYDLGFGHRLVCIRRGHHLVLLYAGSHDDCDRWLERNRGLRPVIDVEQPCAPPADRKEAAPLRPVYDPGPDADDAGLQELLTEKDLRVLFRGLCGQ